MTIDIKIKIGILLIVINIFFNKTALNCVACAQRLPNHYYTVLTVGPVGLLDAAVVRNVLALRVDAVEAEPEARDLVAAVLLDDAARLPQVRRLRRRLPPVHQITCKLIGEESLITSFSDLARVTKKVKISYAVHNFG